MQIPRAAPILGLAGLIPFVWARPRFCLTDAAQFGLNVFGPRFIGPYAQLGYGTIMLAFMSGGLWGFSTRAEGAVAASGYVLSVIPAQRAFLFVGGGSVGAAIYPMTGFTGLPGPGGAVPPWIVPFAHG